MGVQKPVQLLFALSLFLVLTTACSTPPKQSDSQTEQTPPAETEPTVDAILSKAINNLDAGDCETLKEEYDLRNPKVEKALTTDPASSEIGNKCRELGVEI